MGSLANKIRYNNWCSKMDGHEYFGTSLTFAEKEKLFLQTRSGKLTPAQCDSIMDRNRQLVLKKIGCLYVGELVESLIGEDYTVAFWNWGPDKRNLFIYVKESEKFIQVVVDNKTESARGYVWYHDVMEKGPYTFLYKRVMEIPE